MSVPNASVLKMSDVDTMKFVELYESEPVLWDTFNSNYKKRDAREAAARRIANQLNIKDFTAQHVLMKLKNLRSSYSQELKKIAESTKSGISADEVYVPKVCWFTKIDGFLKPHVKASKTQSNLQSTETNDSENMIVQAEPQAGSQRQPLTSSIEISDSEIQNEYESSQILNTSDKQQPEYQKLPRDSEKVKKRPCMSITSYQKNTLKRNMNLDNTIDLAFQKLDDISKKAAQTVVSTEDQFDTFAKYIASILRTLPTQSSLLLQQEIISLVLREQMQVSRPTPTMSDSSGEPGQVFSPAAVDSDYSLMDL